MEKRIIIVDDHPIVRQGFTLLINQQEDLHVCGEAEDAASALELIRKERPDLVLVDISLKDSNGMELIKDLSRAVPDVPALVISLHDETVYAERVLRAGAKGFIMKAEATSGIMHAIRSVLAGGIYLSERMRSRVLEKMFSGSPESKKTPVETLSDRELEIFQLIGEGCGTRDIAYKLSLSVKTVETHKSHIKSKLDLQDGNELIQYAVKWSLSENPV